MQIEGEAVTLDMIGALTPEGFAEKFSIGVSTVYRELGLKRIRAKKFGSKTLIPLSEGPVWLSSLPDWERGDKPRYMRTATAA